MAKKKEKERSETSPEEGGEESSQKGELLPTDFILATGVQ